MTRSLIHPCLHFFFSSVTPFCQCVLLWRPRISSRTCIPSTSLLLACLPCQLEAESRPGKGAYIAPRNLPALAGDFRAEAAFCSWCIACFDPSGMYRLDSLPTQVPRALSTLWASPSLALATEGLLGMERPQTTHTDFVGRWNQLAFDLQVFR